MDDDGDDRVHFAPDARGGGVGASLRCEHCGSASCFQTDRGDIVCLECGTQSQDVRNLEGEDYEGAGIVKTRGGAAIVRSVKRGPRTVRPSARDTYSTQALIEALQHVLRALVDKLVRVCGCPSSLEAIAGGVWFDYLERWAAAPGAPPPAIVTDKHLSTGTQQQYWAALHAIGFTDPPRCVPFSFGLLLCVCQVACRIVCAPVLPHDLCAWARNGTLPYINSFDGLPLSLQAAVSVARAMFTPSAPPSASWLGRMSDVLSVSIGRVLPPVNAPACAARLINLLRLPAAAVPIAVALCALDEGDRALPSHGPRSKDPLDVLRRAVNTESPASYVAGIVATAVRQTPGWCAWVEAHLQPSAVNDSDCTAALRARSACSVGPWGASPCSREVCISDAIQRASDPSAPPHPDVPLPWTTIQTRTMPRELLGTYVRFAGACILRGGEYAPGRGETGYAPGRYGPSALATVTVADAKTAADIELRTALRTESGAAAAARAQASAQDAEAGTLLSLLMSGDDEDDAHREAAAVQAGPCDVEVALGARKDLLSSRLSGTLWRQGYLYDVADLSRFMRSWGENEVDVDVPASAPRTQPSTFSPGESGADAASVSATLSSPHYQGDIATLLATPMSDAMTAFPPVNLLDRTDRALSCTAESLDDTPGDNYYKHLLSMLSAATDSSVQVVAAQADAVVMLLQYYTPQQAASAQLSSGRKRGRLPAE